MLRTVSSDRGSLVTWMLRAATASAAILIASVASGQTSDPLAAGFENPPASAKPRKPDVPAAPRTGYWLLQDAKARFSELVRKVRSEGPQHVTVHGRDEVVVIAAEEFRRLKGSVTGKVLIEAMQASPHREIDIEPTRGPLPVREVSL